MQTVQSILNAWGAATFPQVPTGSSFHLRLGDCGEYHSEEGYLSSPAVLVFARAPGAQPDDFYGEREVAAYAVVYPASPLHQLLEEILPFAGVVLDKEDDR